MLKMIYKIVLIAQVLSLSRFAICDTDPHFESRGYTLTQDSWVFSPDKAKEVRNRLIDLDTALKINESYKTSLDLQKEMAAIQEKKVSLVLEQNDTLAKNLQAERTISGWERIGYFILGIGAAVLGGWAIGQVAK